MPTLYRPLRKLALWVVVGWVGAGHAAAPAVQVQVRKLAGTYRILGQFDVAAPPALAWAVLTDYAHFGDFISSIRKSVLHPDTGNGVFLEQEATAHALVFSKSLAVVLAVHEEDARRLAFEDVSHRDFDVYLGAWTLRSTPQGTQVEYRLRAKPKMAIPTFMGTRGFESSVRTLLTELENEIERRQATALPPPAQPSLSKRQDAP